MASFSGAGWISKPEGPMWKVRGDTFCQKKYAVAEREGFSPWKKRVAGVQEGFSLWKKHVAGVREGFTPPEKRAGVVCEALQTLSKD